MTTVPSLRPSPDATDLRLEIHLGESISEYEAALARMENAQTISRIWDHDHTVWHPDSTEITNRLGWLDIADRMQGDISDLKTFADGIREAGYTQAVLCGMGGSSLAPEVLHRTFGATDGYLDLVVVDSTHPDAVLAVADRLDWGKTLFIISTKSGGTVETLSFFKYFYNRVGSAVGADHAGEHFIAITDPGSSLVALADEYGFRRTFLNDPNIGGRYSALSHFGLVPAALLGIELNLLLERAVAMAASCRSEATANPAARLGAVLGAMARTGCDKITFMVSPALAGFGDWVEQLIAESLGKDGKGILPVVGESVASPDTYRDDRFFVCLRLPDDETSGHRVEALKSAGLPVVCLQLRDPGDLGALFFLWEMATAIAGEQTGVHPFDQPNVESAKVLAREMVAAYKTDGKLPAEQPALEMNGVSAYTDLDVATPTDALDKFIAQAQDGAYIAIQAYLPATPETASALGTLRTRLRDRTRCATTLGYGPRFLHSTGQLHKGDAGKGLFIQVTAAPLRDADIPDKAGSPVSVMTFGVLNKAQALGDRRALLAAGRRVIRFDCGSDVMKGLQTLIDHL